jgi:coenzyme F420-reducing hydrogenase delta subunit
VDTLATGIDLPHWPIDGLRRRLAQGLAQRPAGRLSVVFGCDRGARVDTLAAPEVLAFSLPCTALLPPSFVEYALRAGADSVLVTGCREGGCEYRLGQRWTAQRLAGQREPRLRAAVEPARWGTAWADAGDEPAVAAALEALRRRANEVSRSMAAKVSA